MYMHDHDFITMSLHTELKLTVFTSNCVACFNIHDAILNISNNFTFSGFSQITWMCTVLKFPSLGRAE